MQSAVKSSTFYDIILNGKVTNLPFFMLYYEEEGLKKLFIHLTNKMRSVRMTSVYTQKTYSLKSV